MIITPTAHKVLDADSNTYWFPKDDVRRKYHLVHAIDFGDDACCLAGPFLDKYGLIFIEEFLKPKRLNDILSNWIVSNKQHIHYLPHNQRQRIINHFGGEDASRYFFTDDREMISEIDVQAGYKMGKYPYSDKKCSMFASTKKGVELLFSPLTDNERWEHERQATQIAESHFDQGKDSMPCAERPYMVSVHGNDDASWGRNFATLKEAQQLVKDLEDYGWSVIREQMHFTN
jgi:hypothetical protein